MVWGYLYFGASTTNKVLLVAFHISNSKVLLDGICVLNRLSPGQAAKKALTEGIFRIFCCSGFSVFHLEPDLLLSLDRGQY